MKRMIISPAQLKAINEATDGGEFSDASQVANQVKTQPTNDDTSTIYTNTNPVAGVPGVTFKKEDVLNNTVDFNNSSVIKPGTPSIKIVPESRFSKRQVELGRMLEMRRTGKVFSKKQLNEMFMETQENADRLRKGIGDCSLYDIFMAIEDIFPEEVEGAKEAFSNGANLPEYICSIFSKGDINSEKEEKFLERLGL